MALIGNAEKIGTDLTSKEKEQAIAEAKKWWNKVRAFCCYREEHSNTQRPANITKKIHES